MTGAAEQAAEIGPGTESLTGAECEQKGTSLECQSLKISSQNNKTNQGDKLGPVIKCI